MLERENMMIMFLFLEASDPRGTDYRVAIGCTLHPTLASVVIAIARLF